MGVTVKNAKSFSMQYKKYTTAEYFNTVEAVRFVIIP